MSTSRTLGVNQVVNEIIFYHIVYHVNLVFDYKSINDKDFFFLRINHPYSKLIDHSEKKYYEYSLLVAWIFEYLYL